MTIENIKRLIEEMNMFMFCKCDTLKPSFTTHVVNYKGSIIIIRNVPCEE